MMAMSSYLMCKYFFIPDEVSRGAGAQTCDCIRERLWGRFPFEEMKYLFFSFLRSGVEAKSGVEFRRLTRNASGIRRKVENRVY